MHGFLLSAALFGQADVPVLPSPAPAVATSVPVANSASPSGPASSSAEDMKKWLLARLIVDLSFDPQKSAEVERLLNTLDEQQLLVLVAVYQEKLAQKAQVGRTPSASNQQAIEQAKLNLQQAEAYRDHLKREYDRSILQGYMTQNLVQQNILNNQAMLYLQSPYLNGTFGYGYPGYGGFGYGGYGYGPMLYGNYYGTPGLGNSMMYAGPSYGQGVGFW